MKKAIRKTKQLSELRRLTKGKHELVGFAIGSNNKKLLKQAKLLHSSAYLDLGFIKNGDIAPDGVMSVSSDPHQLHSQYFAATERYNRSKILATARMIIANDNAHHSFPIVDKGVISTAHMSQIESYDPNQLIEISGLAKQPGVSALAPLLLYKAMFDYSLNQDHKVWLMALDTNVYRKMDFHFGSVLQQIGPITSYKGGDIVPLMMHIDQVFHVMHEQLSSSTFIQRRLRRLIIQFFQSDLSLGIESVDD